GRGGAPSLLLRLALEADDADAELRRARRAQRPDEVVQLLLAARAGPLEGDAVHAAVSLHVPALRATPRMDPLPVLLGDPVEGALPELRHVRRVRTPERLLLRAEACDREASDLLPGLGDLERGCGKALDLDAGPELRDALVFLALERIPNA